MLSNSIILYGIGKIIKNIKEKYNESYMYLIINNFRLWIIKLLNKSLIIRFLTSQIGPEEKINDSLIFNSNIGGLKKLTRLKKLIKFLLDRSLIIRLLIEKDGNYIFLLGLVFILPLAPTSIGLVLSLGIIGLTIMSIIYKGNHIEYPKLYLAFLLFFISSIILSQVYNIGPKQGLEVFIIYMVFTILALFVPYIVDTEVKLDWLLNTIGLTVIYLGLYGFYQFIFGAPMDEAWLDKELSANLTRVYSFFGNPNVYGEYLVMVLPIMFALFYKTKNKIKKVFYLGIFAFGAVNVLMTLSRGSMLSLAIAMVILVVLGAQDYLAFLVLAGLVGSSILPESIIRRILSIFKGGDTSTSYRKSIYQASIDMLKDYSISGTGLGQFKELYKVYSLNAAKSFHAHNTILMIYIEMGILGLISFLAMIITWSRDMITSIKYKTSKLNIISLSIFAGIIGCSIQGMVDHIWHNYDIMFIYFLLLGLGSASSILGRKEGGNQNG